MKRVLALAALMTLTLAGCSNSEATDPPLPTAAAPTSPAAPETQSPTTTPTTQSQQSANSAPSKSGRGNLVKSVGAPFGLTNADGSMQIAQFTVTGITVNPTCTASYPREPENGYFVKLDISGSTKAELAPESMYFNPWKVIQDNGTTFNGEVQNQASWSCLMSKEQIPNAVGPGENIVGSIVLDVPTEHGVVVLGNWEWNY